MRSCPTPDRQLDLTGTSPDPPERISKLNAIITRYTERTPMGSAASSPPGHRCVSVPRQLCKKDFIPPGGAPREAGGRRDPAGLGQVGSPVPRRGGCFAFAPRCAADLRTGVDFQRRRCRSCQAFPIPIVLHSTFCLLFLSSLPRGSELVQTCTVCTLCDLYNPPLVAILRDTCWEDL